MRNARSGVTIGSLAAPGYLTIPDATDNRFNAAFLISGWGWIIRQGQRHVKCVRTARLRAAAQFTRARAAKA